MRLSPLIFSLAFFFVTSCNEQSTARVTEHNAVQIPLNYAEGFSIKKFDSYTELTVIKPWPNASRQFTYAILNQENTNRAIDRDAFDGVLKAPITDLVVTSTTHIPALELLHEEKRLVGFPGCDYISSTAVRERIDNGLIKELGKNEGLNTEVVLDLKPDVVIGFGIDGINKTFETLTNANIPVIYNGDWAEDSPLAKAEWIKLFGVLFNKEAEANQIFDRIETNYLNAKALASKTKESPTVLSGAMHKDVWYLPYGSSPEGQFLKDANVNYLWQDSSGSGSLALSFETVFLMAKDADLWINPSYFTSYAQLESNNELYTKFEAFKNKSIFSMSLTKGSTGGVLYYELGTARPDLVLKDIIKICHPDLIPDYKPVFFKDLADGNE